MKKTLFPLLLTSVIAVADADDSVGSDTYLAIAMSEYGMFETGKDYAYASGWHADSMIEAIHQAQIRCEWEASKKGTRCVSSTSVLGGCIALVEGSLELEPDDKGTPTNWSRLFVASSPVGRSEAEEAATQNCESIIAGYNEDQIKSWDCKTVHTLCGSDIDDSNLPDLDEVLEPLCDDENTPEDAECWTQLLDVQKDCYVWSTLNNRNLFAALDSGMIPSCSEKVLNGVHRVLFSYVDADDKLKTESFKGPWKNGRMSGGMWIEINTPYENSRFSGYRNHQGLKVGEWTGYSERVDTS